MGQPCSDVSTNDADNIPGIDAWVFCESARDHVARLAHRARRGCDGGRRAIVLIAAMEVNHLIQTKQSTGSWRVVGLLRSAAGLQV